MKSRARVDNLAKFLLDELKEVDDDPSPPLPCTIRFDAQDVQVKIESLYRLPIRMKTLQLPKGFLLEFSQALDTVRNYRYEFLRTRRVEGIYYLTSAMPAAANPCASLLSPKQQPKK